MNPNWVTTKNKKYFRFRCKHCGIWKNTMADTKKSTFINGYCRRACMAKGSKNAFYDSDAWRKLRYSVLVKNGRRCMTCGAHGLNVTLHVDHIKPRSKYPELELVESNLQVLCEGCNLGKGNWDETDWRPKK